MHYDLRSRQVYSLPGVVAQLLSQSPHLHAQGEPHPFTRSSFIPSPLPLRFAPLTLVILDALSNCWFRESRKRSLDWCQAGMWHTAVTCSPRNGGGRRESAKVEGKQNGELRPQLRDRTSASGRQRDRGDHRRPACHLKGTTRRR